MKPLPVPMHIMREGFPERYREHISSGNGSNMAGLNQTGIPGRLTGFCHPMPNPLKEYGHMVKMVRMR